MIHELSKALASSGISVRLLTSENKDILQNLLDHCEDFFLSCEGESGTVEEVLTCLPPGKTLEDKLSLGFFQKDDLIGFMDLILGYPSDHWATIGYFLIHPDQRSQGHGETILRSLVRVLKKSSCTHVQCVVQEQNPKALKFWKSLGFSVEREMTQKMDNIVNKSFVLTHQL